MSTLAYGSNGTLTTGAKREVASYNSSELLDCLTYTNCTFKAFRQPAPIETNPRFVHARIIIALPPIYSWRISTPYIVICSEVVLKEAIATEVKADERNV